MGTKASKWPKRLTRDKLAMESFRNKEILTYSLKPTEGMLPKFAPEAPKTSTAIIPPEEGK